MGYSQAIDRLSCSSKTVPAVRFTGARTRANRETPENEDLARLTAALPKNLDATAQ